MKNQNLKKNLNQQKSNKEKIFNEKLFSSDWFIIFLFILTTFIVYSNSFNVPFQFDDDQHILLRESNHSLHDFTYYSYWINVNNRPVSSLTLALNYVLDGENVFGYHVVNFIIHLLSGIILFFWIKLIFSLRYDNRFSKWLPLVITLFFLLHPVQTQSVTYIVQRMTSLAGMFFLLSVFLYTKSRIVFFRNNKKFAAITYFILAIFTGILGALSKQNAVVFPVAMFGIELFFIRNANGKICKKYLISAIVIGVAVTTIFFIVNGLPYETKAITRLQYFATQLTVIPRYFQMMLVPIGLSIDHGVKAVKNIFDLKVILGAASLVGILLFAVFQFNKRPVFSFGIFWIFISLIIESSIFPISDMMFDQRMYLPLVGFSIAMWSLIFDFVTRRNPKLLFPVVLIVLISMSIVTYARNNVWKSSIEIWEEVTERYPNHFRGWQGLGREYVASGEKDISKIIRCYERALQIEPNSHTVINDLAANYLKINNYSQAIFYSKKLENSNNLDYRSNAFRICGIIYLNTKNYDLAIKYLEKLIQIKPNDIAALLNLSTLYVQIADYEKAIIYAEKTLAISPNENLALLNIGYAQILLGRSNLSKYYLQKALDLNPSNTRALSLFANACVNLGEYENAISFLKRAYEISKEKQLLLDIVKVEKLKKSGS